MSNNEKKDNLNDLKDRLWKKILILEKNLEFYPDTSEEYRKTLDAYHKIVKSYLDIIKVQRYAPGGTEKTEPDDLAKTMAKVAAGEKLEENDKKTLQQFKEFVHFVFEKDRELPSREAESCQL